MKTAPDFRGLLICLFGDINNNIFHFTIQNGTQIVEGHRRDGLVVF